MPKTGIFDDSINFASFMELREKITALQYMTGEKDFSNVARNLLTKAVEAEIESLPPDRRKYFEQIRLNVRAANVIRKQKLIEQQQRAAARRVTVTPPPEYSSDP